MLRYRTGDYIDGGLVYEPCPHCGRSLPRLVGNISRRSEVREMNLDKIKGTLVDFNELDRVLDDAKDIGSWQVELRKINDDPLELDEVILHVQKINGTDEAHISRELRNRCIAHLEIQPNQILFHTAEEMQRLLVMRNCRSITSAESQQNSVADLVRADKTTPLAIQATMPAARGKAN